MKDIGKDLLCASHDDLRGLFRRFKVLPRLRALARGETLPDRTNGSALFARVRQEQKRAAEERAAIEKAEAEKLSRFYQQSTALGEAQFKESNALMYQEIAEREALQQKMCRENPETVKAVQAFVQKTLDQVMRTDMQHKVERNLAGTQEMLQRHKIGDNAAKERSSIWEKFRNSSQNSSMSATQKRIEERNQDATAELRRRREAAMAKKQTGGFFSTSKSPTFDVVGSDEVQQQPTAPKPTRWW